MLHLSRNILLAEEGAQNAFLFKRGFSGPVALQELFDVLVIHTFLIVLYISDVCKTEKLQENEKKSHFLTFLPSHSFTFSIFRYLSLTVWRARKMLTFTCCSVISRMLAIS